MGASNSKPQNDKAVLLCRERKHVVRQAIEGRNALAAAHVSYIRSLERVGESLRQFVEPGHSSDSSLYTSTSATSATPEPFAFTDKALPRFSYATHMSNHVEGEILSSPALSSPYSSSQIHVNHMKSIRNISTTIKEKPNIPVTVMVHNLSNATTRSSVSEYADSSSPPSPVTPQSKEATPWDYFDIFPSVENQYSFQAGRDGGPGFDEADYLKHLREEEGIPDLEEEGGKDFINRNSEGVCDFQEQEDFLNEKGVDHETKQQSVASFGYEAIHNSERHSRKVSRSYSHSPSPVTEPLIEENKVVMLDNDKYPVEATPEAAQTGALILKRNIQGQRETSPENVDTSKDFVSSINDIELLFRKASVSGKEVQKMLEANVVHYLPNITNKKSQKSQVSLFLSACLACCDDPTFVPSEQAPNALKLIAWHQSTSALSSSSKNPLASASMRDDVDDSSNDYEDTVCMNSGSHASTLDRLYAWERKLSDEVKASGFIRREYDMKCKQLRHVEARGEKHERIDKTRADVKDLHSRILVAIHRIDSISMKIEELRDKELHPQLEELIGGTFYNLKLAQMWKMMYECHQAQHVIVRDAYVSTQVAFPAYSQSHRQQVINLVNELSFLNISFTKWISAHKLYVKSLYDWLLKCVPQRHKPENRRKKHNMQFSPRRDGAPPIFVTCRDWSDQLGGLPVKEISNAVKDLASEVHRFLPPQEDNRAKNSNLTTSLSWKTKGNKDGDGYKPVDFEYREAHTNLHSGFESLRSRLVYFFEVLVLFAAKSSEMYESVKSATLDADVHYQLGGKKANY